MIQTANDIFVLHTEHTTYAFRKLPTGQLEHLYYGRKIHEIGRASCRERV